MRATCHKCVRFSACNAYFLASGSLTELHLGLNQIGDEGAKAIADAVAASGSLTHLSLDNNKIGDAAKQRLRDAVRGRQGFRLIV